MKITPPSFNQIAALIVALFFAGALVVTRKDCSADVRQALIAGISLALAFMFASSSGSQSKDASATAEKSQLIEALKNSTPASTEVKNDNIQVKND